MKTAALKTAALKTAVLLAALLAAGSAAQANVTPFDGTRQAKEVDVVSLVTGPVAAELERSYFQAPAQPEAAPQNDQKAGRCTEATFVFAKMSLAQACY